MLTLADQFKDLLLLDSKRLHGLHTLLSLFRLQQILDENRVKRLVRVLLNNSSLHVGSELLGLFLKLVNRNLSD